MSEHSRIPSVEAASLVGGVEGLPPAQRRVVHNAVVNNAIEGWTPTAAAVADLAAFASGAITAEQYRTRVLAGVHAAASR